LSAYAWLVVAAAVNVSGINLYNYNYLKIISLKINKKRNILFLGDK